MPARSLCPHVAEEEREGERNRLRRKGERGMVIQQRKVTEIEKKKEARDKRY